MITATFDIVDNDTAGVSLSRSGTTTNEAGATQTVGVELKSQPTHPVSVFVGSSKSQEATLSLDSPIGQSVVEVQFTPENWNQVQTVTVKGVNDDVDDDATQYQILSTVVSEDLKYNDDTVNLVLTKTLTPSTIPVSNSKLTSSPLTKLRYRVERN